MPLGETVEGVSSDSGSEHIASVRQVTDDSRLTTGDLSNRAMVFSEASFT